MNSFNHIHRDSMNVYIISMCTLDVKGMNVS